MMRRGGGGGGGEKVCTEVKGRGISNAKKMWEGPAGPEENEKNENEKNKRMFRGRSLKRRGG